MDNLTDDQLRDALRLSEKGFVVKPEIATPVLRELLERRNKNMNDKEKRLVYLLGVKTQWPRFHRDRFKTKLHLDSEIVNLSYELFGESQG